MIVLLSLSAEGIETFLKNLATVAQSAEEALVVLATFISTGIGGVILATKQVRKRVKEADAEVAALNKPTELTHLEELIKQEQNEIDTLQKSLNLRCTNLENNLLILRNDITPKKSDVPTELPK